MSGIPASSGKFSGCEMRENVGVLQDYPQRLKWNQHTTKVALFMSNAMCVYFFPYKHDSLISN